MAWRYVALPLLPKNIEKKVLRFHGIVPLTMKGITHNVEDLEFGGAFGEARRIRLAVLSGGDVQPFLGGRMRDQRE
jgi:hypothetical protein